MQDSFGNIPVHDAKRIQNREILNLLEDVNISPVSFDARHPFVS